MPHCGDPKCIPCNAEFGKIPPPPPPFPCRDSWYGVQQEAERIIAPDGRLIFNPIERNRRINAAYAKLWLDDRRFQWAGLAAFASKQVGCGLLNAADMIRKSNQQRDAYKSWANSADPLERLSPFASPPMSIIDQTASRGAQKIYHMLALGNTALFLDIWPLHMFYKRYGLSRLRACLPIRQTLGGSTLYSGIWPIGHKLAFGRDYPEILQGFEAIESGSITRSVNFLASHEQKNILQPAIYEDAEFQALLRANQVSFVTSMPSGLATEIQLTLANQCSLPSSDRRTVSFSHSSIANLSNINERMVFVLRAANRFNELLDGAYEKHQVEFAIQKIAAGESS